MTENHKSAETRMAEAMEMLAAQAERIADALEVLVSAVDYDGNYHVNVRNQEN